MKPIASAMLTVPLALAAAGCSLIWASDVVQPGDKVRTPEQAIKLAIDNCGPAKRDTDRDHWDAHLEENIWIVNWSRGQNGITAAIEKHDGSFVQCDVNILPK